MASLAAAAVMGGSSLLGGIAGGKGAEKAAKIAAQSQQQALQLQQNEFNTISGYATPTINAGGAATQQILRALGLGDLNTGQSVNGNPALSAADQQQGYLSSIASSPLYTNALQAGLDTNLQTQAATGGVRGGNAALANSTLASNLYDQVYQNDLSNLFNLSGMGNSALGTLSGAGSNFASQASNTLSNMGSANAVSAAAPYAAIQNALSGLGSAYNKYSSANSFANTQSGITSNALSGLSTYSDTLEKSLLGSSGWGW